jgi:tRNA wybutosine-synthesizing protein 3
MNSTQSPMVAIRSNGLALDAIIGVLDADGNVQKIVSDEYIAMLVRVGNMRFQENDKRIAKLTRNLEEALYAPKEEKDVPEDKEARRERKRLEGLRRQQEVLKEQKEAPADGDVEEDDAHSDILGEILSR